MLPPIFCWATERGRGSKNSKEVICIFKTNLFSITQLWLQFVQYINHQDKEGSFAYFDKWENGTKPKITWVIFICSMVKWNKLPMFSLLLSSGRWANRAVRYSSLSKNTTSVASLSLVFLCLLDPYGLNSFQTSLPPSFCPNFPQYFHL